MDLTPAQLDRAAGALLGTAAGDALGAGYEFGPPVPDSVRVYMKGGGGFDWAPGEWTDDTSMAIPIARAVAEGLDLRDDDVLDGIVASWVDWARTAPDVGIQLGAILRSTAPNAAAVRLVAKDLHDSTGRSAGNGSLMRTAPVALGYLDDAEGLAAAARALSDLTHYEADAGDACVLWSLAIRHAVLTGELDVRVGIPTLPAERAGLWLDRITDAEAGTPADFEMNGWVVQALQGAWSAVARAATPADGIESAVRGGRDADTVAAIAGGLIGAARGAAAVPAEWSAVIHGWPGLRGADLIDLAVRGVRAGR
jgi:ADP-ribosyl-[dinitrogen reductase] hydrolase